MADSTSSDIYNNVLTDINTFKTGIQSATYASKSYVDSYKLYASYHIVDSDLLKERMKNKVAEALNSND